VVVLIEPGLVEQCHQAVLEVMGGLSVTEVALRLGVTCQTVHRWLRRYGHAGVADASCRSARCPVFTFPEAVRSSPPRLS